MRIVVPVKQVPDLVEELELNSDGSDIDREFVKFVANEWDEQALEEALLIKEAVGAQVTVVAFDEPDVEQTIYTAIARGADDAVKLTGVGEGWLSTADRARILAEWLSGQPYDLVITGVQASDDLDGQLAGTLGGLLGVPHAAVVVGVEPGLDRVTVAQELAGGTVVRSEITTPCVLGMQTARQAPRYAPISRIRQAISAGGLASVEARGKPTGPADGVELLRLYPPEKAGRAEMLSGDAPAVAERIVEILASKGLVKK
ncbi:MAG: electron transfer flavoprotein subunit beta/FixA family protein [Acidimicrobiales bacterium]